MSTTFSCGEQKNMYSPGHAKRLPDKTLAQAPQNDPHGTRPSGRSGQITSLGNRERQETGKSRPMLALVGHHQHTVTSNRRISGPPMIDIDGRPLKLDGTLRKAPLREGNFDWTPQAIETLRSEWASGVSAGQIGDKLGVGRSPVLGKINRLRKEGMVFEERQQPATQKSMPFMRKNHAKKPVDKPMVRSTVSRGNRLEQVDRIAPLPMPVTSGPLPESHPCTIQEFGYRDGRCRFPITDEAPYQFCGASGCVGSWCSGHAKICYRLPEVRLDRRPSR